MTYSFSSKNSDSYSLGSKSSPANSFLLKEDAFFLLLETGDKIVLDGVEVSLSEKNTGSYTLTTKN